MLSIIKALFWYPQKCVFPFHSLFLCFAQKKLLPPGVSFVLRTKLTLPPKGERFFMMNKDEYGLCKWRIRNNGNIP